MSSPPPLRGRGSAANPKNRFESVERVADPQEDGDEISSPETQFFPDHSKSLIAYNDSPDIPFDASINPYRGCEHGCIYCFARPSHAYLGMSPGLDFETRIFAKHDAADLLRSYLSRPSYQPRVIAVGASTDPYQPAEGRLGITRSLLEVFDEFSNPVAVITK